MTDRAAERDRAPLVLVVDDASEPSAAFASRLEREGFRAVYLVHEGLARELSRVVAHASAPAPPAAPARAPEESVVSATTRAERPPHDALDDDALASVFDRTRAMAPLKSARDAFERAYLLEVLRREAFNVSAAARVAGRNRTDFYSLLRRHGITPRRGSY